MQCARGSCRDFGYPGLCQSHYVWSISILSVSCCFWEMTYTPFSKSWTPDLENDCGLWDLSVFHTRHPFGESIKKFMGSQDCLWNAPLHRALKNHIGCSALTRALSAYHKPVHHKHNPAVGKLSLRISYCGAKHIFGHWDIGIWGRKWAHRVHWEQKINNKIPSIL